MNEKHNNLDDLLWCSCGKGWRTNEHILLLAAESERHAATEAELRAQVERLREALEGVLRRFDVRGPQTYPELIAAQEVLTTAAPGGQVERRAAEVDVLDDLIDTAGEWLAHHGYWDTREPMSAYYREKLETDIEAYEKAMAVLVERGKRQPAAGAQAAEPRE